MSEVQWRNINGWFDVAQLGRYSVIVWTGSPAVDLDDGLEVCSVFVPVGDRALPDGAVVVGRRRMATRDRACAREEAMKIAHEAIAALGHRGAALAQLSGAR